MAGIVCRTVSRIISSQASWYVFNCRNPCARDNNQYFSHRGHGDDDYDDDKPLFYSSSSVVAVRHSHWFTSMLSLKTSVPLRSVQIQILNTIPL